MQLLHSGQSTFNSCGAGPVDSITHVQTDVPGNYTKRRVWSAGYKAKSKQCQLKLKQEVCSSSTVAQNATP